MQAVLQSLGFVLDWGLVLTYLRIQICILTMPGFGEAVVSVRIKVAVAMSLTPLLAENLTMIQLPSGAWLMFQYALAEMLLGFAMGMMVRLMAFAINIAATAIASTASLSQIIGSSNEASPHPIGNIFHLGGIALLLGLGLPIMLVRLLADGFDLWPAGGLPSADEIVSQAVDVIARSFQLAMILASPFILGGFLFQALSGVINRVMPALPVVFIGAPAAILLALCALVLLTPMIMSVWADAVLSLQVPAAR